MIECWTVCGDQMTTDEERDRIRNEFVERWKDMFPVVPYCETHLFERAGCRECLAARVARELTQMRAWWD